MPAIVWRASRGPAGLMALLTGDVSACLGWRGYLGQVARTLQQAGGASSLRGFRVPRACSSTQAFFRFKAGLARRSLTHF